jgi:hypothetical protein
MTDDYKIYYFLLFVFLPFFVPEEKKRRNITSLVCRSHLMRIREREREEKEMSEEKKHRN